MRNAQFLLNLRPCFTGICLLTCLLGVSRSADAQLDGQMGHTALPTVGRNTGITHLELFPYVMIEDEAILFGNVRGFVTNEGNVGGNFGGGFRILEPNDIVIVDNSTFQVRNQRSSVDNGRVYRVTFVVADSSGNATEELYCDIGIKVFDDGGCYDVPVYDGPEHIVYP